MILSLILQMSINAIYSCLLIHLFIQKNYKKIFLSTYSKLNVILLHAGERKLLWLLSSCSLRLVQKENIEEIIT